MSEKPLTVLFTPLDGYGHINACHGLAEALRDRGHRVVFAIDIAFKGKLIPFGFEEEIHSLSDNEPDSEFWAEYAAKRAPALKLTPIGVAEKFTLLGFTKMLEHLKERDSQYIEIIAKVKPDVIIVDSYVCSPTLTNSGIPWVRFFSAAPLLCFESDRTPPAFSGLPTNGDKKEWEEFRAKSNQIFSKLHNQINEWCASKGAPLLSDNSLHPRSPYLNLYMYPKELDYPEAKLLPGNWMRVDCFVRATDETFEIPDSLKSKSGKLVFLTLGSFGCVDLDLMKRITGILGKSEHRFIVSKGPLHKKYELPDNMWGQKMVPQTKVLPLVDLVITHGGNNTVTETFYFGKPMIVMPLFSDQFDNAQRIQEMGFGVRLSPFTCDESELLQAVDNLLADQNLAEKMRVTFERIRNSDSRVRAAEMIEKSVRV